MTTKLSKIIEALEQTLLDEGDKDYDIEIPPTPLQIKVDILAGELSNLGTLDIKVNNQLIKVNFHNQNVSIGYSSPYNPSLGNSYLEGLHDILLEIERQLL